MLVDFRVQPPFRSLLDLHFFRRRPAAEDPVYGNPFAVDRVTPRSFIELSLDLFLEEMDEAGVDHAVIMGQRGDPQWGNASNDDIARMVSDYPDRFTGFAGIDPHDNPLDEAKRARDDLGLTGLALVPGWGDPPVHDDDPRLMPLYEWCSERGVAVSTTASHFIGPDMLHAHPVHIQRVALRFPELRIIVAHGAWPWTTAAVSLAMRCTNVYLMPDFYMYLPNMAGAADYVGAANGFLKHRMLYSSCYPSNSLGKALEHARRLSLTDDARHHLLEVNGARLLAELAP